MAQDEKMLVPVEPTDAMVEAAYEHWLNKTGDAGRYVVRNIIKAALSAAPVQPATLDEGAAGEPVAWEVRPAPNDDPDWPEAERMDCKVWRVKCPDRHWPIESIPSSPADDALRVAVEALKLIRAETNVLREDCGLVEVRGQRLTKWHLLADEALAAFQQEGE